MISTPLLIYYIYISSSILIMLYAWRKDKGQMNVQLDGVAKFVAFMAIATMARLCILSSGPVDSSVYGLKMTNFLTVFFFTVKILELYFLDRDYAHSLEFTERLCLRQRCLCFANTPRGIRCL